MGPSSLIKLITLLRILLKNPVLSVEGLKKPVVMKDEIIIAYLKKELPPGEMVSIENWIGLSGENKNHFDRVKLIWENAAEDFSKVRVNSGKAWDNIQNLISKESLSQEKHRSISIGTYLRIAASVVMLLGIGYLSSRLINNASSSQDWIIVETGSDRTDVELPDGSHVWLNHHTKISYPGKFKTRKREVRLSGEAFFDVTRNRRKPFTVTTETSVVEVLGTSFNVESGESPSEVIVTVVEGKVALSKVSDPAGKLILEPGDKGTHIAADDRLFKERNRDHNFLAWKTGILIFENAALSDVCSVLSEHFDKPVIPDHHGTLETKRLTATYQNRELEDVLTILALTLEISYEVLDDSVTLSSIP